MTWITASIIEKLPFLLKISKHAIAFYWRSDTHCLCHLIQNQFVPELVRPLTCLSGLARYIIIVWLVFFFFFQIINSLHRLP